MNTKDDFIIICEHFDGSTNISKYNLSTIYFLGKMIKIRTCDKCKKIISNQNGFFEDIPSDPVAMILEKTIYISKNYFDSATDI